MKQERLVHWDINTANILVSFDDKLKISGLGSAQKIEETPKSTVFIPKPGTIAYLSPEMYIFYRFKCEIFFAILSNLMYFH